MFVAGTPFNEHGNPVHSYTSDNISLFFSLCKNWYDDNIRVWPISYDGDKVTIKLDPSKSYVSCYGNVWNAWCKQY